MPSVSKKQHGFMAKVATDPKFAKQKGISQSVGEEFLKADKGRKFGTGGGVGITRGGQKQINKQVTRFGSVLGNEKNVPNVNLNKYIGHKEGGMATKEMKKLFKGKETMKEELAEAKAIKSGKITPMEYAKGEKMEGHKKGGVAKTVTKEMEYDYKTGKKSFAGTTAQRDRHAEKEGKIVAKHAAYDKDMDMMAKGGQARAKAKGMHSVQKRAKEGAEIVKMAKGGLAGGHKSADGCAVRGKTRAMMPTMKRGGKC